MTDADPDAVDALPPEPDDSVPAHPDPDQTDKIRRYGKRTWPERVAIAGTIASALLCFLLAAALVFGYLVVRQRNIADFENPADIAAAATTDANATTSPALVAVSETTEAADTTSDAARADTAPAPTTIASGPTVTFPMADPEASNFLITGADNGACVDPDSPYAATFGDREGMGERSDTIMVLRVDPDASRVAILSFPRDLYVEIADGGGRSRINSAYERDRPQRLADTIYENFDIPIDHYIQVDFCAFKTLVDAVGGVAVPFEYPARDDNTGLNVPTTGCFTFDGEHALAYVRSRHYQYEDPPGSGDWREDPTSDLGRISRQQDFLRRTLASLLDSGPLKPRVARGLIRATTTYITTDRDLTPARMLEFAGVMNDVAPGSILTYQIEATGRTVGGAAVLVPNTDGDNMQAVLAIFRGETSLGDALVQEFEDATTAMPRGSTTTVAGGSGSDAAVGGDETSTAITDTTDTTDTSDTADTTEIAETTESAETSTADGAAQQNEFGIVPPRDQTC